MNILRTVSILSLNYKKDKKNGDFIEVVPSDACYELSIPQAKQLKIFLKKILDGKKPKQIKFKEHPFAYTPYVCYYNFDNTLYIGDSGLNDREIKQIYKWLSKYIPG